MMDRFLFFPLTPCVRAVAGAVAVAMWGVLAISPAAAQSADMRPLYDRIDRLERQLQTLEQGVYRGTPTSAPAPVSSEARPGGAAMPAAAAASIEVRLGEMETEMRNLTGRVEELGFVIGRLGNRLDKLVGDVDLRLRALEEGPAAARLAPAETPPNGPSPSAPQTAPAAAAAENPTLPEGTPQEQYDYAVGLLMRADRPADYEAAGRSFQAFLDRHPDSALRGNAQYWLGESFYVRRDYSRAAVVFADGYKLYPDGRKAEDNLLKLGMALGQLGKNEDACRSFAEMASKFPKMRAGLATSLARERDRYGCR